MDRRTRIILEVLYRHMLNNRAAAAGDAEEEATAQTSEALPLRILSDEEAAESGATCRFCFEGPRATADPPPPRVDGGSTREINVDSGRANATITSGGDMSRTIAASLHDHRLVAPCGCTGHSEWVHVSCLRQWQSHATPTRRGPIGRGAASICNVCTIPYSLPPPPPPRLRSGVLRPGTLLVHTDQGDGVGSGGMFHRSVVLLLSGTDGVDGNESGGACGVIVNSVLPTVDVYDVVVPDGAEVLWRRGGPVCGGRFGVTRHVVAHELNRYGDQSEMGDVRAVQPLDGGFVSLPIFSDSTVGFVYELDGESSERRSLANFESSQLQDVLTRLTSQTQSNAFVREGSQAGPTHRLHRLIFFSGYCRWARGQLERELRRGLWTVCNDGTGEDIWRSSNVDLLWDELANNATRSVPTGELFE